MNLGLAIFLIIIALLIGLIGGFYGARAYNSRSLLIFVNSLIRLINFSSSFLSIINTSLNNVAQMGQKPSAKKLNQVMNMMKHQQQK